MIPQIASIAQRITTIQPLLVDAPLIKVKIELIIPQAVPITIISNNPCLAAEGAEFLAAKRPIPTLAKRIP